MKSLIQTSQHKLGVENQASFDEKENKTSATSENEILRAREMSLTALQVRFLAVTHTHL